MEIDCPHCHNTDVSDVRYVEYVRLSYPLMAVRDDTVILGKAQYDDAVEESHLECVLCSATFRVPDDVDLSFPVASG